ncbi:hypothetical protein CNEO_43459 [Clostridium neonatale]|uniref:Uncharacterized protein n=1 Tax=Clostridium neonatale TaxID=137838 RepID=A0AA86JJZ3_9CLOT|nr:hypothetical protein CNEO_43459 [Clostridium neonatale]
MFVERFNFNIEIRGSLFFYRKNGRNP